jgi:hypothetical protein
VHLPAIARWETVCNKPAFYFKLIHSAVHSCGGICNRMLGFYRAFYDNVVTIVVCLNGYKRRRVLSALRAST